MDINLTNLGNLRKALVKVYNKAFESAMPQWPMVAMRASSNASANIYAWLGTFPGMKKFVGEITVSNISQSSYEIVNEEFSAVVSIPQKDIEQDNIGMYDAQMKELGDAAMTHPDELIFDLLSNGFTQKDYTGKNFFDVNKSHAPNNAKVKTKFSNKLTAALSHASFTEAVAMLKGIRNAEGRPMNLGRKLVLVVPPSLEVLADQIVSADLINNGETNVNKGKAKVECVSWLASDSAWFLLECGKPMKPLIYQVEKEVQLTHQDRPEDQCMFENHEARHQAYGRYAVGYGLPQLAVGSTGEA